MSDLDDLINRLRGVSSDKLTIHYVLMREAADTIERLRVENEKLMKALLLDNEERLGTFSSLTGRS